MSYIHNIEHYNDAFPLPQGPISDQSQITAPAKPRRKPQSATERAAILTGVDSSLSDLAHVDAGPTLQREITNAKALTVAADQTAFRKEMSDQRLTQRSGVFMLLVKESTDFDLAAPDARVMLHLDIMLELSANVAAFTGSPWSSTLSWFRKRLPSTVTGVGEDALADTFAAHLAKAKSDLAGRIIVRPRDLLTGRTAQDIAHALGTTTAQLRAAKANTCRLTSVDAQPKPVRDRETKEAARRAAGMTPQANRRMQERDRKLAQLARCGERTIRSHRLAGTLTDYLVSKGVDTPETAVARNWRQGKEEAVARKWRAPKEITTRQFQATPSADVASTLDAWATLHAIAETKAPMTASYIPWAAFGHGSF